MIRVHVSAEDLTQTRFAFSPLWETVAKEVKRVAGGNTPALEAYLQEPAVALENLAGLLVRYHERVLAPHWPQLHTLLEADVFKRTRTPAFHGPEALFGELHRSVGYRSGAVEIQKDFEAEVDPGGRGVLLIPVAFAWPDCR